MSSIYHRGDGVQTSNSPQPTLKPHLLKDAIDSISIPQLSPKILRAFPGKKSGLTTSSTPKLAVIAFNKS